ncbi:MAG: hypothetical protein H8E64_03715 [Candidatus Marinimicrobia bacterium]|nr:hypothetical protein [Candidatus Neomarinimicrobiota bacterium]
MGWFENSGKYDLSKNDTLDDLSERLIIECENRWKEKLGTREFGLNKN